MQVSNPAVVFAASSKKGRQEKTLSSLLFPGDTFPVETWQCYVVTTLSGGEAGSRAEPHATGARSMHLVETLKRFGAKRQN
jgi:hypothetical protein